MSEITLNPDVKRKSALEILYNGRGKEFDHRPHELVGALLAKALERFEVVANPHLMSLFDAAGNELAEGVSLKDAGVEAGAELVLRQSTVKGG